MSERMPKGWKKVKLGEVVEIGSSKRIFYKEYVDRGIPFYRSKEIIEKHSKQEISTALFITEEKYNEINNKFSVPQEWVGKNCKNWRLFYLNELGKTHL